MNRDELNLLLYFETAAVDYGGKLDLRRMNEDDFAIAKRWNDSEYVRFGRIAAHDIQKFSQTVFSHWCVLSNDAWIAAHVERRARNVRVESKLNVHRNGYDEEKAA